VTAPRVVRISIQATYADVRTVDQATVDLLAAVSGTTVETLHAVELAVHEVCTNIVEHAYGEAPGGRIDVTLTLVETPHRYLTVELQDDGKPYDASRSAAVNLDEPQEGGYGLYLAQALMDEVEYKRTGDRNIWRLTKSL
jgi:serine/threonine-protein kinase RsbW